MQSGYTINDLVQEAQRRWLKPAEVLFILQNHENHQFTNEPPQKPASGSMFLFNKRILRFFRKDGHSWRRKKDGRTVGEAHERLKVGNVEALNCYYAHGDQNPNFQRRSYWILDPAYEHIVLVHYRDINEGKENAQSISHLSPGFLGGSSSTQSPSSNITQNQSATSIISEFFEPRHNISSPGSVEVSSHGVINSNGLNQSDIIEKAGVVTSLSNQEFNRALRKLEEQLSLNDDSLEVINSFYSENRNSNDSECIQDAIYDDDKQLSHQWPADESTNDHNNLSFGLLENNVYASDGNDFLVGHSLKQPREEQNLHWINSGGNNANQSTFLLPQEVKNTVIPSYSHTVSSCGIDPGYSTFFDQYHIGVPLEADLNLTISQKQKFTIREISPEWGYASEATQVIIIGSFLCDPSDCHWTCMFGDVEVPIQIIQEGVVHCEAPPFLPGKVTLCITSGNRESCSEVREFEYLSKPSDGTNSYLPETVSNWSSEELLLLVGFVQMLLTDHVVNKREIIDSGNDQLAISRSCEDSWGQVIEALLVGNGTSSGTIDWLLQELLKDKLQMWLSSRSLQGTEQQAGFLSKKEQGIIHKVAGLGFEWALNPILKSGVSVNFRDINGWTALHWAARFGREKMVASLIASGALAGAVTDPNTQDPTGKTPASVAATCGHKGLAGYLSEVELTSHLSSLTFNESELSKGPAEVEAEKTVDCISERSLTLNEDHLSLKVTLAAVRNAAQAAARIQSAFRSHSFRKRQHIESVKAFATEDDEYIILSNGLSAASKLAFGKARDYNAAALSIQKKYRGWKGRKDFLAFRQKVVKIQAHVRGHQVRKHYKVCWAVGILEKVVLRWRRHGVGLRGFRPELESIDESEDEDILKVFRKQKVDAAIDEAVSRVLSMVDSLDARQQYRRILERYRQAKAELADLKSESTSSLLDVSYMQNDDL